MPCRDVRRRAACSGRCDLMDASPPSLPSSRRLQSCRGAPTPPNEYVDAPFLPLRRSRLPPVLSARKPCALPPTNNNVLSVATAVPPAAGVSAAPPGVVACGVPPVSHQPRGLGSSGSSGGGVKKMVFEPVLLPTRTCGSATVYCERCGRCRCGACAAPRTLPRRWLCAERYECSGTQVVEACSCLCVVRAAFYHGCRGDADDVGGPAAADAPCGAGPRRCERWACMAAASVTCLPCLCFYWPLRGALALTEATYDRLTRRACRCHDKATEGGATARRLLLEPERSST